MKHERKCEEPVLGLGSSPSLDTQIETSTNPHLDES